MTSKLKAWVEPTSVYLLYEIYVTKWALSNNNSPIFIITFQLEFTKHREIYGSHGGDYEEYYFLRCVNMYSETYRRLEGLCYLRLEVKVYSKQQAEHRDSVVLWNIGNFVPDYTMSHLKI
jgi:hypothetical protein